MSALVGIIMGSDSDFLVMQEAVDVLKKFEVPFEIGVYSAHRSPHRTAEYVKTARDRGLKLIIAGAGASAHLAGVTAAEPTLPVIGVPSTKRTWRKRSKKRAARSRGQFNFQMRKTFHISNFGCRASQSEGASIQEELVQADATEASEFDANVVIVNSCTVTEEADRQVRQMIRRVASRNPKVKIIVTGCYAQRAPEELANLAAVRYVVGNSHKPLVGALALRAFDEDFPT